MNSEYNLNNHKNNIFAIKNYGDNGVIYIKDVLKKEELMSALYEFDCQEISLSKEGVEFLENYYSLKNIADMVLEEIKKGVDYKYTEREKIIKWLQNRTGTDLL